jgi:hypothetical protein
MMVRPCVVLRWTLCMLFFCVDRHGYIGLKLTVPLMTLYWYDDE